MDNIAEFLMGSTAACGACIFTNPLEVVKTRMQLQGELQARGTYARHYRNVFHAFYTIAKVDGITALQKGLVPALVYQAVMNGVRLGTYQHVINSSMVRDREGNLVAWKCIIAGGVSGCVGAFIASPFYMVSMGCLVTCVTTASCIILDIKYWVLFQILVSLYHVLMLL